MARRLTAAALSLLSLLALTSCTGKDAPEQPQGAADPPRIVVASGQDVTGKNGIRQQLIDAWNAQEGEHGYRARLVELPGSADQQRSQLLGALQSGGAEYDVVNLDVTWIPEFAAAGLIRPLTGAAVKSPDDIIEAVDRTSFWDGERYAVPFNSDVGLLYYRKDHLRGAGTSRTGLGRGVTWDDLRELIDAVNDDPTKPGNYEEGWTTQLAAYEGRTVNAIEAFASAVPDFALTDEDGRYTADEEQLTAGVTELRERTQSPPYMLDEASGSREAESLSAFAEGRTTFLRHWPYVYPALYERFKGNLGVTRLPGKAVLGGQNLAVTSNTSEQRAAKAAELIAFLTDPDSERCLLRAGFAATRTSAYRHPGGTPECRHASAYSTGASASPTGESAEVKAPDQLAGGVSYSRDILLPALSEAVQRPRTPLYGAVTQTLITQLGALYGPRPPRDAEVAKNLDEALSEVLPD
ncbi:ABC transporter substrate-binding protein [Streptomyces paradoxus]|uniref:Multiple sugar transport system substrate-binding protein n=1 Tax=Streptomyces paradoxus TaxID=66375 RepID=A0A7W9WFY9_9ACTN|nr:extracellular solute-binding protein [Streptomyces paradoxus]MBB6077242.1 multiple sugar transport system substrate-binding protein [Streptomyces paradoxus]